VSELHNAGSVAWPVIESNKPSFALATNACNAVPHSLTDPERELTEVQFPNQVAWRLRLGNAFGVDVVDILFDVRWEFGARFHGGGALITNCYLYVPVCSVLWGFEVNVGIHVHAPTNAGTDAAPIARLPLTFSGNVDSLVQRHPFQRDLVPYGDGSWAGGPPRRFRGTTSW
jgi:hypothetical protein